MKKIFTVFGRGLIVTLPVIILLFVFSLIANLSSQVWRPLILVFFEKDYLITPLSLFFSVLIIMLVGFLFSHAKSQKIVENILRKIPIICWIFNGKRIPENIKDMPAALLEFGPEAYYITMLIKIVELKFTVNKSKRFYLLYSPSVPVPWTGLPLILASEKRVIPLKVSFEELCKINASFGKALPELIEELEVLENAE